MKWYLVLSILAGIGSGGRGGGAAIQEAGERVLNLSFDLLRLHRSSNCSGLRRSNHRDSTLGLGEGRERGSKGGREREGGGKEGGKETKDTSESSFSSNLKRASTRRFSSKVDRD